MEDFDDKSRYGPQRVNLVHCTYIHVYVHVYNYNIHMYYWQVLFVSQI